MPTGRPLTEEFKKYVVSIYTNKPMTIRECAKTVGLSDPSVIKILDEYNIARYKKATIYNPDLDDHYFKTIDTEAKAYYLGFIITDGNIFIEKSDSNRQASISISQSEHDKYILERFLQEVRSNTAVGNDGRGTCMVAVRSDIMAMDLQQYGIQENKTLTTSLPVIETKYMKHLIRGILDGDGNITSSITAQNKHKHAISFCGTEELMNNIGDYISQQLNVSRPSVYVYSDRHLSEIKWQSINDCYIIGEWIYEDATIYLNRKKDKYDSFKKHYNL